MLDERRFGDKPFVEPIEVRNHAATICKRSEKPRRKFVNGQFVGTTRDARRGARVVKPFHVWRGIAKRDRDERGFAAIARSTSSGRRSSAQRTRLMPNRTGALPARNMASCPARLSAVSPSSNPSMPKAPASLTVRASAPPSIRVSSVRIAAIPRRARRAAALLLAQTPRVPPNSPTHDDRPPHMRSHCDNTSTR